MLRQRQRQEDLKGRTCPVMKPEGHGALSIHHLTAQHIHHSTYTTYCTWLSGPCAVTRCVDVQHSHNPINAESVKLKTLTTKTRSQTKVVDVAHSVLRHTAESHRFVQTFQIVLNCEKYGRVRKSPPCQHLRPLFLSHLLCSGTGSQSVVSVCQHTLAC